MPEFQLQDSAKSVVLCHIGLCKPLNHGHDEEIVSLSGSRAVTRPEASRFRCTNSCSARERLVIGWTVVSCRKFRLQKFLQQK